MRVDFLKNSNFEGHKEFFTSSARKIILYGGAGSGKSYSVADRFALETFLYDMCRGASLKFVVVRKSMNSMIKTSVPIIKKEFEKFGVPFSLNQNNGIAKIGFNSSMIFISINNDTEIEKVKSLTDVDGIFVEEVNEISYEAYNQLITRLRGSCIKNPYLVGALNPVSVTNWVYTELFCKPNNIHKIKINIETNRFIEQEYIDELDSSKELNYSFYKIYRLGEWGDLKGVIYDKWKTVDFIPEDAYKIYYGLDFGFSVGEAALVRIYQGKNILFFEELVYSKKLTNDDLAYIINSDRTIARGSVIYCDSAEPKSIEELRKRGINVKKALKGPDSVRAGINFLQFQNCNVLSSSTNIIKEMNSYTWRVDRAGNTMPEPVKIHDHAMDAIRYAVFTYNRGSGGGKIQFTKLVDYNEKGGYIN